MKAFKYFGVAILWMISIVYCWIPVLTSATVWAPWLELMQIVNFGILWMVCNKLTKGKLNNYVGNFLLEK